MKALDIILQELQEIKSNQEKILSIINQDEWLNQEVPASPVLNAGTRSSIEDLPVVLEEPKPKPTLTVVENASFVATDIMS